MSPATTRQVPRSLLLGLALVVVTTAGACGADPEATRTVAPEPASDAQPAPATDPPAPGVTVVELDLVDPTRPTMDVPGVAGSTSRALPTTVHLPLAESPAPLVLLAHGAGGSPARFTALATYWAERGYVVAAPRFPLSNDLVPTAVLGDLAEQARDVRFVIDEVLARSASAGTPLTGRVDAEHIGTFGLSMGALTVWDEVLGATPDGRVDALVQSDGVTLVAPDRFGEIRFPVFVAHSDVDGVFPYADVVAAYDRLPGEKYLLRMHGAVHATVAEDTVTPADAVYREATTAFWDRTFRGRTGAPFPASVAGITSFVEGSRHLPATN